MSLSDHSESIHASIQRLRDGVSHLQQSDTWDWLDKLFSGWGISEWLRSLVKTIIYALVAFLFVLLLIPCLLQCLQKLITHSISGVLFVQQEGGDVGQGLKDNSPSTDSLMNRDLLELVGHKPWEPRNKLTADP